MGILDSVKSSDVTVAKPLREKVNVMWENGDSAQFYGTVLSIDDKVIIIKDNLGNTSTVFRNSSSPVLYVEEVDE